MPGMSGDERRGLEGSKANSGQHIGNKTMNAGGRGAGIRSDSIRRG